MGISTENMYVHIAWLSLLKIKKYKKKQLRISFGSLFLLFSYEISHVDSSQGKFPAPPVNDSHDLEA